MVLVFIAIANIGMWPSGKAPGFGPGIRGFESLHPSHKKETSIRRSFFMEKLII